MERQVAASVKQSQTDEAPSPAPATCASSPAKERERGWRASSRVMTLMPTGFRNEPASARLPPVSL